MSSLRILVLRILATFRKGARERELDQEIRAHIELLVEENLRKGMSPTAARHAALRDFGGVEQTKEIYREHCGLLFFETLFQDIRYAFRMMRQNRVFTAVAVLSLALGIGANTAIFSFLDAVVLRSVPVEHPEQLLLVTQGGAGDSWFTNPIWEQLRDHQDFFSGIFAWGGRRYNLASGGEASYVPGIMTSGDFFRTLGIYAILGRTYTTADDRRGCEPVAVLNYDYWQSRYAGDGSIVGKQIMLDRHPFEIIGVLPPGFHGLTVGNTFAVAAPICSVAILEGVDNPLDNRWAWWLSVMGRPKPSCSWPQITTHLKALAPQVYRATVPSNLLHPSDQQDYSHGTFGISPGAHGVSNFRNEYRDPIFVLMIIVAIVLLIACANIANLLLARAALRRKEIAVRLAIGAARSRLIRQLLTESVLLSLIGAALGVLFANWGSSLLVHYVSVHEDPAFLDVALNLRILGFTSAAAVATGILFGVVPAWRGTNVPLYAATKESARGLTRGHARLTLGKALVVCQVALSLVLLVGGGLLVSSFWKLAMLDPGLERHNMLFVAVDPGASKIPKQLVGAVYDQVLESLRALPSVRSASRSFVAPISGSDWEREIQVDSFTPQSRQDSRMYRNRVSPGFFKTLGIPLLAGRDFNSEDTHNSTLVAVVNESLAKKFFPGMNPIGKFYLQLEGPSKTALTRVVGIVKDSTYRLLREGSAPTAYVPMSQDREFWGSNTFEIRTAGPPTSLISAVKTVFARTNPDLNLEFTTLTTWIDESLNRERLLATLSGFFGALALLLAAIGLYGVMSYTVARRRNEIGIRMALGAEQKTIQWMVLREVLVLVGAGLLLGFAAATATTRLITSMLYGLTPTDPTTLTFAGITLLTVAALAGYLPARRAAQLDPMTTLREE
jgi:putative ABC transport system permease protein